jgi:hypothetical protein
MLRLDASEGAVDEWRRLESFARMREAISTMMNRFVAYRESGADPGRPQLRIRVDVVGLLA